MKILLKSAAVTALLLGSGLTQAATTTSSIPMGVDVPKSCTFSNVSAGIILPEDGSEAQGAFSLLCNTGSFSTVFSMDSKAAHGQFQVTNPNGVGLPIEGAVSIFNYDYRLDDSIVYGGFIGQVLDYIVKAKLKSPTTATTPAGVYTDTFRVNVTY
ncbi:hypothetical protein HX005_07850 [Acinetobacter sp. R933-2]|uniref:hypothetical protein n=1 Tax=Acinetobacter sp. R933-2 TaxID=2746728 RepID=UPI002576A350|nr:hypothetical protein [Acinetobacter sp. R933-2]MDM1247300.1 hypothetical protein [Acinetobacter sp. R933-2]